MDLLSGLTDQEKIANSRQLKWLAMNNGAQGNQAMANSLPAQGMVPYAEGLAPEMDQRILQAVMGEQAMKNAKGQKLSQQDVRRKIASTENGDFEMNSEVPQNMMDRYQKEEDKTHQQVIKEYMKKREALAKNSEDRARLMGESFQGNTDLSPLMALSDSWFGGNLSKGYKAPETLQQNQAAQQGFENQAANQYGQMTDDEMNMLRQGLMGEQWQHKQEMDAENLDLRREELNAKRENAGKKDLSEGLLKRLDYTEDGMNALTRMRKAVNAGDTMRPDIPLVADNNFTEALRDAAENYGRMQSGGAINEKEEARFVKAVWKMGDTREDVLRKIGKQMNMFQGRKNRVLSGGRSPQRKTTPASSNNNAAKTWLASNPNHPKAAAVRAKLGE